MQALIKKLDQDSSKPSALYLINLANTEQQATAAYHWRRGRNVDIYLLCYIGMQGWQKVEDEALALKKAL